MKKATGILLLVVGYGVGGYVAMVGFMLGCVLLMPVIATSGEEMGRELAWLTLATLVIVSFCWWLTRMGHRLVRAADGSGGHP